MDLNFILWIVQILLALAFVAAGFGHVTMRGEPRNGMEWTQAVPRQLLTTIGILEILGAVGLIVPAATGILPALTPLAASVLALLMLFAAIFHLRRGGETMNAVSNIVVGLVALFVAYGRFVLEPFV